MADTEPVVLVDEPQPEAEAPEVQYTKKWVSRGPRGGRKGKKGSPIPKTGGSIKAMLERVGDAAYVGVVEQIKNADPQNQQQPVFVINRDIVPVSVLHDKGLDGFKADIVQEYGDGSYALRFLGGPNFSYRLKDPETGDALPDVPFLVGKVKSGLPEERTDGVGDARDDWVDLEGDDLREASHELTIARMQQRIKRLREEGGGGQGAKGGLTLEGVAALIQALKPQEKPAFEVEAMKAIFAAQREAAAEMQKTLFASFGEMLRQVTKFRLDDMRQERGIEEDPFEDAPWPVKAGARILERVADSPIGQAIVDKIGSAPARTGSPGTPPQPAKGGALPSPAQARHSALTRLFRMITESVEIRPDPAILVDKHLKNAFGMCGEPDRAEMLQAIRKLRGGDFSGMEGLFGFLRAARVPGVQEFAVRLGQDAIAPQWVKDVLLELLEIHEPEPEAGPTPSASPGSAADPGPLGSGGSVEEVIVKEEVIE